MKLKTNDTHLLPCSQQPGRRSSLTYHTSRCPEVDMKKAHAIARATLHQRVPTRENPSNACFDLGDGACATL